MKKKKVIISICLVIVLSMSAFVAVQATSGDENNIFEQLKALITGNTNRIEKLENKVDTLESEIDKLKGEITELQKPTEEEKATETEKKETTTSNSNKKPTTNTTTKKTNTTTTQNTTATDYQKQVDKLNKEIEKLNTSIEELKKQDNKTTTDYKKQVDTLNNEISVLKKSIEELEKQDSKQTKEIETLKTELNNKSEELKKLINNNSSSSSSNANVLNKKDLIGSWTLGNETYTFNDNNTATVVQTSKNTSSGSSMEDGINTITETTTKNKSVCNYTYTIEGNYIMLTLVNATNQVTGGTKVITTKNIITGEETTETVEIKAEDPVDTTSRAYKQLGYTGTVINNTLYLNGGTGRLTKNK